MARCSKGSVNYRLPKQGCYVCKYAYNNSYGDNCCRLFDSADNIIDAGAICDMYETEQIEFTDDVEVV